MRSKASDEDVRLAREAYARGGVTHAQLSEQLGIPEGTIQQWIAGLTRNGAGGPITRIGVNGHLARRRLSDNYVKDANGCWLWNGRLDKGGYGRLKRDGQFWFAHRYSWTLVNGPIPEGLTVDHLCFVPACVNPEHLRLLSGSENSRNQRRSLANVCKRGHKLTPENTQWSRGTRRCRICLRDGQNKRNARLRAERGAA